MQDQNALVPLASSCESRVPGFRFYAGADYARMWPREALRVRYARLSSIRATDVAAACLQDPTCKAFNDLGFLYSSVPPASAWIRLTFFDWLAKGSCTGVYVRATEPAFGALCTRAAPCAAERRSTKQPGCRSG